MTLFYVLWALLLCLYAVGGTILAACLKRAVPALLAFAVFASSFFLYEMAFDLYLNWETGGAASISRAFGALPRPLWALSLLVLTLAAALLMLRSVRYGKSRITPAAIKTCVDGMPCGVCYWRDSGRVIFSNHCMDRLCIDLTGQPLLNGSSFRRALPKRVVTSGGRAWRFSLRELSLDGEPLHEMIASDITEEYAKTQALQKDTVELARINRELQSYRAGMEESIRRREILQAKVNIHDEMNRLLLSIMTADSGNKAELDAIFSLWKRNALLLCMEADADRLAADKIGQFAKQMNVRLVWRDALPAALTAAQRELFASAAREAVVNAAKHAGAAELTVSFAQTDTEIRCVFENGGSVPSEKVRFTGGLANLSLLAKEQGAVLSAETGETFRLTLRFAKKEQK